MPCFTLKITHNGDTRRFRAAGIRDLSFASLAERASTAFPDVEVRSFTYKDEDGDHITITNDSELADAIIVAQDLEWVSLRLMLNHAKGQRVPSPTPATTRDVSKAADSSDSDSEEDEELLRERARREEEARREAQITELASRLAGVRQELRKSAVAVSVAECSVAEAKLAVREAELAQHDHSAVAVPALGATRDALLPVTARDFREVACFRNPPAVVVTVMHCLMHLLAGDETLGIASPPDCSWTAVRKAMSRGVRLIHAMQTFQDRVEMGQVPAVNWERSRQFMSVKVEDVARVSRAAHSVAQFCITMHRFHRVYQAVNKQTLTVADKSRVLKEAQDALAHQLARVEDLQQYEGSLEGQLRELNFTPSTSAAARSWGREEASRMLAEAASASGGDVILAETSGSSSSTLSTSSTSSSSSRSSKRKKRGRVSLKKRLQEAYQASKAQRVLDAQATVDAYVASYKPDERRPLHCRVVGDTAQAIRRAVKPSDVFLHEVQLMNSGLVAWEGCRLAPMTASLWLDASGVEVPRTEVGESVTVKVPITAPAQAGKLQVPCRMLSSGFEPFGEVVYLKVHLVAEEESKGCEAEEGEVAAVSDAAARLCAMGFAAADVAAALAQASGNLERASEVLLRN